MDIDIEAPVNGTVGQATVSVLDDNGAVRYRDKADLDSLTERKKLSRRLAKELNLKPTEIYPQVDAAWNDAITRRRRGEHSVHPATDSTTPPAWESPIPLVDLPDSPDLPDGALPSRIRAWVDAIAVATQTPPDLPAMLALVICGAGIARKYRIEIRPGYCEPTNLCGVVALPPGERKSAVFAATLTPVQELEREELERRRPEIAAAASEYRQLEAQLKSLESRAGRADNPGERDKLRSDAQHTARQLATMEVPEPPQFFCDDATPEKLARLLSQQGGRMLQAGAEGTAFEIAKGRYSETANFDVYLKGHAGDPLRVSRVSRKDDSVDQPALSVALTVQPDVIRGLADQTTMRGRGFLARFLYSIPTSRVGMRKIAAPPVPDTVSQMYRLTVRTLWELPGTVGEDGRPAPHWIRFSPEADACLQEFERWLEPQLKPGERLSFLAGWANKLTGAIARIAGILHAIQSVSESDEPYRYTVKPGTVEAATRLGRNYLLPHAQIAFGLMGSDTEVERAQRVLEWIKRERPERFKRWQAHKDIRSQGQFARVEDLDAPLQRLVRHHYLRLEPAPERQGRGRPAEAGYEVNPAVFTE